MTDTDDAVLEEPEFHEILTGRLRLRTVRVSDIEAVMPLITRKEVMYWTSQGPVSTIEQGQKWLSARAQGKDVFNFAIEPRTNHTGGVAPILGLAGCFHPPEIGYMIHPDYAGKGYATEALNALVPEVFKRFPPASEGGIGFDHIEGWTDIKNVASQKILQKCGFTLCETMPDPDNQLRGPSEILIFRKARPGKTLEGLGLDGTKASESPAPAPPVE